MAIIVYVGNMSGGKTISMVNFAFNEGLKGKKVISNIKLNFPKEIEVEYMKGNVLIEFIKRYYEDSEMLKAKFFNSVVLADELVNIISSRKSNTNLNELVTNWAMMISKLQVHFLYSCQMIRQIDIRLLEVTNKVVRCYRIGKVKGKYVFIDPEKRTIADKIIIVNEIWENDGLKWKRRFKQFNADFYYPLYDTFEMTLLDKTIYLKGGKKDLGKSLEQKFDTNLFNFD